MGETKTYIVPDQRNDLSTLALMNGGNNGFGGGNWNNPLK